MLTTCLFHTVIFGQPGHLKKYYPNLSIQWPGWLFYLFLYLILQGIGQQPVLGQNIAQPGKSSTCLTDTGLLAAKKQFSFQALKTFYQQRNFRLLWFHNQKLIPAGENLIDFIKSTEHYGLIPQDYPLAMLEKVKEQSRSGGVGAAQAEQAELLLSDSFIKLAYQLRHGRMVKNTYKKRQKLPDEEIISLINLLSHAEIDISVHLILEKQQPVLPDYLFLREELVSLLKKRDTTTLAVGQEKDLKTLIINLERRRWEEDILPPFYILVNIPAFQLSVFQEGDKVLESRVIVGKPGTPSPVLDGKIECLMIYPYWFVPRSIAVNEILPRVQKDLSYLAKNHFEVLDRSWKTVNPSALDWSSFSSAYFPFTIRQSEGLHNALGVVKFIFDNEFGVYLHDTNAPQLFQQNRRALSHGCIRVERARDLAKYLLRNDSTFARPGLLDVYFNTPRRMEVSLPEEVPLHIRYFTAENQGGSLALYQDIYRKDEKMIQAFFGK